MAKVSSGAAGSAGRTAATPAMGGANQVITFASWDYEGLVENTDYSPYYSETSDREVWMRDHAWFPPGRPLTPEEIEGLRAYSGNDYSYINKHLRDGTTADMVDIPHARMLAAEQASLRGQLDIPTLVYRMVDWGGLPDEIKPGRVFYDRAFISTAARREALSFEDRPVRMEIELPRNTRGIYLNAHGTAKHPNEQEFLLPPGAKFKVRKVTELSNQTIIRVRLVAQGRGVK